MIVFEKVFTLFIFIIVGYLLSKLNRVDRSHSKLLSALLVYVFAPTTVFKSFSTNFSIENIVSNFQHIAISAVVLAAISLLARLISCQMTKHPYERHVYSYSLTVPNFGYMGYALVASLFGDAALFHFMIFAIPVMIYAYTIGFNTLTKRPITLKKLINPSTIALMLGCTAGILHLQLPQTVLDILNTSSGCMAPVSMILAGIVISEFDLKTLISNKKAYLVTVMRLLVIPLLLGLVLKQFCSEDIVRYGVMLYAMPCGLNTIVYPKLVGENCEMGAKFAFLTNIFVCITLPLNLYFLGAL